VVGAALDREQGAKEAELAGADQLLEAGDAALPVHGRQLALVVEGAAGEQAREGGERAGVGEAELLVGLAVDPREQGGGLGASVVGGVAGVAQAEREQGLAEGGVADR
jgi:GNAT superfamily N-acetyltransferase